MTNLEEIKKLRRNADDIYSLFNNKIPEWKSDPKHYDKTGWGFNGDSRFNACVPIPITFSSHKGTYGSGGSSSQLNLDAALFRKHLINYLNKNVETIMLAIASSLEEEAKSLKSKAEEELNLQLSKLAELDNI